MQTPDYLASLNKQRPPDLLPGGYRQHAPDTQASQVRSSQENSMYGYYMLTNDGCCNTHIQQQNSATGKKAFPQLGMIQKFLKRRKWIIKNSEVSENKNVSLAKLMMGI